MEGGWPLKVITPLAAELLRTLAILKPVAEFLFLGKAFKRVSDYKDTVFAIHPRQRLAFLIERPI